MKCLKEILDLREGFSFEADLVGIQRKTLFGTFGKFPYVSQVDPKQISNFLLNFSGLDFSIQQVGYVSLFSLDSSKVSTEPIIGNDFQEQNIADNSFYQVFPNYLSSDGKQIDLTCLPKKFHFKVLPEIYILKTKDFSHRIAISNFITLPHDNNSCERGIHFEVNSKDSTHFNWISEVFFNKISRLYDRERVYQQRFKSKEAVF